MVMDAAIKFIRKARNDSELRKKLNMAEDNGARKEILENESLSFNFAEFEEAFNIMHGNCMTEGEALDLKEFKLWWDFILQS